MKIGVVLVTYNRLEKLKHSLGCYDRQTYAPQFVLVVDNASTDGTAAYLDEWEKEAGTFARRVVHLNENTGGAGGFHEGMKQALEMAADWIWVADDDAYPRDNALEELEKYYRTLKPEEIGHISAICSAVYNGGVPHCGHRNHIAVSKMKIRIYKSSPEEYEKPSFEFNLISYVGACIRAEAIRQVGLDDKDFFIYCDDQEHSIRLNRVGKIICVPASIVDHDTPQYDEKEINWGKYYFRRNGLLMIRQNFPARYFWFRWFRRYFHDASFFLSKKDKRLTRIYRAAYWDALRNKKGLHPVYRPGWHL